MHLTTKGFKYFREEGFKKGVIRLYRETLGRLFLVMSSYIFEVPISNLKFNHKSQLDILVKQLTQETAAQLLGVTYDNFDTIIKWLKNGNRCFIAEHQGNIIAFVWAGYGHVFMPELQTSLNLANDEFYMFDGLTLSKFRRYGVQKTIISEMIAFHREHGYKKMIVSTSVHNTPAIGIVKDKFGGREQMIITLVKIFGIKKIINKKPD